MAFGTDIEFSPEPVTKNEMIRYADRLLSEQTVRVSKALGMTGTTISGGRIEGIEYNTKLESEAWLGETGTVGIVQKMRLSNPQIQAMLMSIKLPIIGAEWPIREADWENVDGLDESAAIEHARTARRGMFEAPMNDFRDTVAEALLFMEYGFFLYEKVWQVEADGTYSIKKFGPRLPQTITKWHTSNDGEFGGVEQTFYDPKDGSYNVVDIGAESLILITHGREGNNFAGISMLRPIWAINEIKTLLLKLMSLAFEREALGIPIATRPEGQVNDSNDDKVAALLKNIRAHQKQYGILPFGWTVEWFFNGAGSGGREAILSALRYLDEQILNAGLAQFLGLGSSASGSRAVAEEHTDLFYMALNGKALQIASAFNGVGRGITSGVIRQLVHLNHGEAAAYPYLEPQGIESNNLKDFTNALQSAGNFITPDDVAEVYVRAKFGMPQRRPEDVKADKEAKEKAAANLPQPGDPQPGDPEPGDPDVKDKKPDVKPAKGKDDKEKTPKIKANDLRLVDHGFAFIPRRPPQGAEEFVRFAEIALYFDTAIEDVTDEILGALADSFAKVQVKVDRAIRNGKISAVPTKLPGLEEELRAILAKEQKRTMEFGAATVMAERKRQTKRTNVVRKATVRRFGIFADHDDDINEHLLLREQALTAQSGEIAREVTQRATSAMRIEALGALRRGESGLLFEALVPGVGSIRQNTAGLTATAFNIGRDQVIAQFGKEIEFVQFSALGDNTTCGPCDVADGTTYPLDSAEHRAHECPFATCAGGYLCRCINVPVFSRAA